MYKFFVVVLIIQLCPLNVFCDTLIEQIKRGADVKPKNPFIPVTKPNVQIQPNTPPVGNKPNLQIGVMKPPFVMITNPVNKTPILVGGTIPTDIMPPKPEFYQTHPEMVVRGQNKYDPYPRYMQDEYERERMPPLYVNHQSDNMQQRRSNLKYQFNVKKPLVKKIVSRERKPPTRIPEYFGRPPLILTNVDAHGRILHGFEAKAGTFPYIVSMLDKKTYSNFCGGTIIHNNYILTAAHCCVVAEHNKVKLKNSRKMRIIAGDLSIDQGGSKSRIYRYPIELIPHSDYDPQTVANDICIVRFNRDLITSEHTKLLEIATAPPPPKSKCEIAGWGSMDRKGLHKPVNLNTGVVTIIDMDHCNGTKSYNGVITNNTLCAGSIDSTKPEITDTCQGDSGGPLVCNDTLSGVVSWGRSCGHAKFPGIYTDVSKYQFWINSIVFKNLKSCPKDAPLRPDLTFDLIMFIATIIHLAKCFR